MQECSLTGWFFSGSAFHCIKSITNMKQRLTSNDTPLHFGEQQLITAVLALFFPFSCIIRALWISRSTLDPQPEGDATELKFSEGRIEYKPQNSLFPLMNWLVSQENIWLVYFQWQDMKEKHLSASRTPNRTALKRSSSELPSLNSFKLCRNNFLVDTRQNWIVLIFLRCQDVGRSPLVFLSLVFFPQCSYLMLQLSARTPPSSDRSSQCTAAAVLLLGL